METPSQVQVGVYLVPGWGGYPVPGRGGEPHPRSGGVPHPRSGGRYPIPGPGGYPIPGPGTPPRQSSTASTCYVAGGVPLAFTQGDFLVSLCFWASKYNIYSTLPTDIISTNIILLTKIVIAKESAEKNSIIGLTLQHNICFKKSKQFT